MKFFPPRFPLVLALLGCAGAQIEGRSTGTKQIIATARANGAYVCAPRDLALAEANVDFTDHELAKGEYVRALEHIALAETHAKLAVEKSPKERCVAKGDFDKDGIPDDLDKCPREPEDFDEFEDEDGCPDPDNDKDGILDKEDKCPNEAEDKDSFDDEDGCPDPDNDLDGVLDASDKCPNEAEDKDGFDDEDGCPDPDNDGDGFLDEKDNCPLQAGVAPDGCPHGKGVRLTGDRIEIPEKIFFATGKAVIMKKSFGLLKDIGNVLKANPRVRIRIEGHTDSRGSRKRNLKLSLNRANAVRLHLLGLGIEPDRLAAEGFGPDKPIASNRTNAGREQNRRVDFMRAEKRTEQSPTPHE